MAEEYLVLIDENDNQIGLEEKVKCHLLNGILHRAFAALIFDDKGYLLLTQRSPKKMLWPEKWDGTAASHPRESETYISSGERRMSEELRISCKLDYLFKFEYHVPYKDIGSENEICGTLIGVIDRNTKIELTPDEISEEKWISASELKNELKNNAKIYCPWMLITLALLLESEKSMLEKHNNTLSPWMNSEIQQTILGAIAMHLPKDKWRIVK